MEHSSHDEQFHDGMQFPCSEPQCCCGQARCAYLLRNKLALNGLEKDVKSAARAGQVCEHPDRVHPSYTVLLKNDALWFRSMGIDRLA